jgi:hypothetical protein
MSHSRRDFVLDMGFIDHLKIQLVITLTYSATVNFHTLQISRAHATSFPARSVFTSGCMIPSPIMAIPPRQCASPL